MVSRGIYFFVVRCSNLTKTFVNAQNQKFRKFLSWFIIKFSRDNVADPCRTKDQHKKGIVHMTSCKVTKTLCALNPSSSNRNSPSVLYCKKSRFVFITLKNRIILMNNSNLLNKYFNSMLLDTIINLFFFLSKQRSSFVLFCGVLFSPAAIPSFHENLTRLTVLQLIIFCQLSWNNVTSTIYIQGLLHFRYLGCKILMCVVFHNSMWSTGVASMTFTINILEWC